LPSAVDPDPDEVMLLPDKLTIEAL